MKTFTLWSSLTVFIVASSLCALLGQRDGGAEPRSMIDPLTRPLDDRELQRAIRARDKFLAIVTEFEAIEPRLRAEGLTGPNMADVDRIVSEVGIIIGSLLGIDVGRALVFRGYMAWWKHHLLTSTNRYFDPNAPSDPIIVQGLAHARKGKQILEQYREEQDISWANDIIEKLEDEP